MNDEFLSGTEMGERFPGEWVLVERAEFDYQWNVVRGVVAAHSPSRDEIALVHREIAQRGEPFSVAVLCFKPMRKDVHLLFSAGETSRDI